MIFLRDKINSCEKKNEHLECPESMGGTVAGAQALVETHSAELIRNDSVENVISEQDPYSRIF